MGGELVDGFFGGTWGYLGFLSVVVPVVLYYALKPSRVRRPPRAPAQGGRDLDAGSDL